MTWYLLHDPDEVENAEIVDASNEEDLNDEIKKFVEDSTEGIPSCELTVQVHKLDKPYRNVLVTKELTICDK